MCRVFRAAETGFLDKNPPDAAGSCTTQYQRRNFKSEFYGRVSALFRDGGGMTADFVEKPTRQAIQNESSNGLSNKRGTLAMARTNLPHSATSQFFINVVDNNFLDRSTNNAGYAVFGQVTKGMDVVDKITKVPTGRAGPHQDVPKQPIKILSVNIKAAVQK
jgi:peptidyl-prolyl cis-trans isomerase A (cyclophilin A)